MEILMYIYSLSYYEKISLIVAGCLYMIAGVMLVNSEGKR